MLTIYHNPRCSKSREAYAIVEAFARTMGHDLQVIEYLKNPPSRAQLQQLQHALGTSAAEMVRSGEEIHASLGLTQAGDERLLDAIAAHPQLLQRPIVTWKGRGVIARPPELLNDFLASAQEAGER